MSIKFRSEVKGEAAELQLTIDEPVVLVGSCFADNIGGRMRRSLWNASNPLGVLFNPLSIASAINLLLFDPDFSAKVEEFSFEQEGFRHSWFFDSRASGVPSEFKNRLDAMQNDFRSRLSASRALFVTFGTAFCYFLADRPDFVVANCHKQPEKLFIRRRVDIDEICDMWTTLIERLQRTHPGLHIIFTVSPVRHLRDGLHQNNLSKSILHLAIDRLCATHDCCSYFPAYEILADDLRDYRFYAADLTHPNDLAIEYIWEKFLDTYVAVPASRTELRRGEAIFRRLNHRSILHTGHISDRQAAFVDETHRLYDEFLADHPSSLDIHCIDSLFNE